MNENTIHLHPVFEKNLQILLQINPYLGGRLFQIQTNNRFEVFQGKDPADINILDTELHSFMYANPVSDVVAKTNMINNAENHLLYQYFYGIGNGIVIKMLLHNQNIEQIVVIEPNLELIYVFLHLFDVSDDLSTGRLILETSDIFNFSKAVDILTLSNAQLYARLFELEFVSNYYELFYLEDILKITQIFTKAFESIIIGYGNSAEDTLMGIEHHVRNLPKMIAGPQIHSLLGKNYPKTAVIVSTGPSLTKQLPLLQKIKDHVTIISVDASFPILEKHGIKPDFVTVLERIPETANFFKNNSLEFQKNVNFVCVSIVHNDILQAIREGTTILQMRPHSYTTYYGLQNYGYLGVGMSAANLAHELAIALEFPNIILIGQDLAFGRDNTSHASGHYFGENEEKTEGHDYFVEAYGGDGTIRTTQYWIMFKNYFERAIHASNSNIRTINCTEGGARIPGAFEMTFADAILECVDFSNIKELIYVESTPTEEYEQNKQTIIDKTNFWIKDSISRQEVIEATFIDVQNASEKYVSLASDKADNLDEIEIDELIDLSDKIELVKDYISDQNFRSLYYDLIQSMLLHFELEFVKIQAKKVESEDDKKLKLIKWIVAHRYWLFAFAGGINAERDTIIRAIQTWPEELKQQIVIPTKKEIPVDQKKLAELMEIVEADKELIRKAINKELL